MNQNISLHEIKKTIDSSQLQPMEDKKIRSYQNGEIILNSEDFEGLLDVFRTLLKWSKDLEGDTK